MSVQAGPDILPETVPERPRWTDWALLAYVLIAKLFWELPRMDWIARDWAWTAYRMAWLFPAIAVVIIPIKTILRIDVRFGLSLARWVVILALLIVSPVFGWLNNSVAHIYYSRFFGNPVSIDFYGQAGLRLLLAAVQIYVIAVVFSGRPFGPRRLRAGRVDKPADLGVNGPEKQVGEQDGKL